MKEKNVSLFTLFMAFLFVFSPAFMVASVHHVIVNINQPAPLVADAGDTLNICPGTGGWLRATGGLTYHWSPMTGLSCTDCDSTFANPATNTKYMVTVTGDHGCSATDSVWVIVSSTVTANAGKDTNVCKGDTTQLHAMGGSMYTWIPATGLSDPTISNPQASPDTTTTYTVIVSAGSCASDSAMVKVSVKKKPEVPTITKLNDSTLQSSSSTSNRWQHNGSFISNETSQTLKVKQNGSYTVIVDSNGCSSMSDPFSITVGIRDKEQHPMSLFSLFPNPNTGIFTMVFDANEVSDYDIEVHDVLGRLIHGEHVIKFFGHYSQQLDLSFYPKGLYSLSLRNGGGRIVRKVVTY